jgi:hypothetical protein
MVRASPAAAQKLRAVKVVLGARYPLLGRETGNSSSSGAKK